VELAGNLHHGYTHCLWISALPRRAVSGLLTNVPCFICSTTCPPACLPCSALGLSLEIPLIVLTWHTYSD